jgi:hypothetical protein
MVAGFIGALKMAVTGPFGQAAVAPLMGVTEFAMGGVRSGFVPGVQHPVVRMSNRNAGNQILKLLYLRMTFILHPSSDRTAAAIATSIPQANSRAARAQGFQLYHMGLFLRSLPILES